MYALRLMTTGLSGGGDEECVTSWKLSRNPDAEREVGNGVGGTGDGGGAARRRNLSKRIINDGEDEGTLSGGGLR